MSAPACCVGSTPRPGCCAGSIAVTPTAADPCRAGARRALDRPPQPPIGLAGPLAPAARQVHETTLEPGDCVLLYTDGVVEARDADGAEFGLDRFTDFIIRSSAAGQRPAEVLRLLIHAILDYQRNQLRDDVTILLSNGARSTSDAVCAEPRCARARSSAGSDTRRRRNVRQPGVDPAVCAPSD
ncbi:PP2C family protein-serine/threonine phosphatase [Streptomyces sp. NPDC047009]|uniref:PP2C family protein-serine/threonine phosphatase n=1 Tax=Streptomyces sp. NPDC047009 TaxID=3154496 RepID=UPI0033F5C9B3